jgi:H/ACA ribonucleoprotein complex subunit 1
MGPPATVLEMGSFVHACEGEMVCESTNTKIPYFNAPVYLENKVDTLTTSTTSADANPQ